MAVELRSRTSSPSTERADWLRNGQMTIPTEAHAVVASAEGRIVQLLHSNFEKPSRPQPLARLFLEATPDQTDWPREFDAEEPFLPWEAAERLWEAQHQYPGVSAWPDQNPHGLNKPLRFVPTTFLSSPSSEPVIASTARKWLGVFRTYLAQFAEASANNPEIMTELRLFLKTLAELGVNDQPSQVVVETSFNESQPWKVGLVRLKRIANLSDAETAHLLQVSRSNVQGWLNRGQGMRSSRQQQLRAILDVLEDASSRCGDDAGKVRSALFTPLKGGGKNSFEYLRDGQFRVARGTLISHVAAHSYRVLARPITATVPARLSREEREEALALLSPGPSAD